VSAGAEGTGAAEEVVGAVVGPLLPYCAAARMGSRKAVKVVVNMILSREWRWLA
jgi:hypothetical protein